MIVFGGDPGAGGCIAALSDEAVLSGREPKLEFIRMQNTAYPIALNWLFAQRESMAPEIHSFMEHVHWRQGDQKKPSQIEQMLRHAAKMEMLFEILHNRLLYVVEPITWQLEFGLGGIETYAERKKAAHALVKSLYPDRKITKDAADGILIAIYGWRKLHGGLTHGRDSTKEKREATGIQWDSRRTVDQLP